MLNAEVFRNVQQAHKKILIVTKYWDTTKTENILKEAQKDYCEILFALGENRIERIQEKNLQREHVHFIGNIQSRDVVYIVRYCSCIHSLASLKHAHKIEAVWIYIEAFVQVKLDANKDIGISESELGVFLEACKNMKYLKIIGISGMGSWDFSLQEKRDEFQKLISLRNTYIPYWIISAGTSRDYEMALEQWIDIVRVGEKSMSSLI